MGETIKVTSKYGKYYKGGEGGYHPAGGLCPSCVSADSIKEKGILVERKNKSSGDLFLGCSRYPECKCTYPLYNPPKTNELNYNSARSNCPTCHGSGVDVDGWDLSGEPSPCVCIIPDEILFPKE